MRLTIPQDSLAYIATLAARAADPTSLSAADRDVLLVADAVSAELGAVAHGGILGFRIRVAADVGESGTATVPADRFRSLVKHIGTGAVALATDANGHLSMVRGRRRLSLPGGDPSAYPPLATAPADWHALPTGALALGVRETCYAGALEPHERSLRPHMAGVRVEATGDRLDCVATDGKRAALRSVRYNGEPFAVTLPHGLVRIVRQGLFGKAPKDTPVDTEAHEAASESIEIAVTTNSVWLRRTGDQSLCAISPKLAGEYPAWRSITQAAGQCPHAATFARGDLLASLRAVTAIERDEWARVPVRLDWQGDSLAIDASRAMGGVGSDRVDAISVAYGDSERGCVADGAYLCAALKSWTTTHVVVRFGGPSTLVCLEPQGLGPESLAVVMPIAPD